jgi:uncharacterized membrane protein YfcA
MAAKAWVRTGLGVLAAAYLCILLFARLDPALLKRLWFVPGVGLLGATIANTSGTGGGVVFVPVFNALRAAGVLSLDRTQIVAASFLIQCFGMTTGALRWSAGIHSGETPDAGVPAGQFWRLTGLILVIALPVLLATEILARFDPHTVLLAFKLFSVTLGLVLIVSTWTVNRTRPERRSLHPADVAVVAALSVLGGFVTALFSVGLGELVALYLFIRHYPLVTCTASAVVVSAVCVLAGAPFHILAGHVPWEVVALAAPGALLGGYIARPVALWLGSRRLKTADGLWIVLSGAYLIALSV